MQSLIVQDRLSDIIVGGPATRSQVPKHSKELLETVLQTGFGRLKSLGATFAINATGRYDDKNFDRQTETSLTAQRNLGMQKQVQIVEREVAQFKKSRQALSWLVKEKFDIPRTVIPLQYLPELFFLFPVWFMGAGSLKNVQNVLPGGYDRYNGGQWPQLLDFFCCVDGWPERRQLSLADYEADLLPADVAVRLEEAVSIFDFVAIAAPATVRQFQSYNDPLIIALVDDLPCFSLLAHYSDGEAPSAKELIEATQNAWRTSRGGNNLRYCNQLPATLKELLPD